MERPTQLHGTHGHAGIAPSLLLSPWQSVAMSERSSHSRPSVSNDQAVAGLFGFIAASPSPYHAAQTIADGLLAAGFVDADADHVAGLHGSDDTGVARRVSVGSRRGFRRLGGAIVAWNASHIEADQPVGFRIIGAHTDSPNLRLRPLPDRSRANWLQATVEVYGGALLNSWLDRDLGISGRVVLRDRATNAQSLRLIATDEPLFRVPQLAIHLDRGIRDSGLLLNPHSQMNPVWGLGDDGNIVGRLGDLFGFDGDDVCGFDLMLHDVTGPSLIGADKDLIAAPRLDNQFSCWAGLDAFVRCSPTEGDPVPVLVCFDHEEVGSETRTGAGSRFLERMLDQIADTTRSVGRGTDGSKTHADDATACAGWASNSVLVSADMAHAVHPNYPDRHDENHWVLSGNGPAIKVNSSQRYATDGPGIAFVRSIAERAGVDVQMYSHRGDLPCGSTIGPIAAANLGIATIDIGAPQLSMHSARELMAVGDVAPTRDLFQAFFGARELPVG